jgi:epoxyqueuosine reductase
MDSNDVCSQNAKTLEQLAVDWGISLVGFANLAEVDLPSLHQWPRAVSMAMALDPAALVDVRDGPTVEYYEEYKRVNRALNEIAGRLSNFILGLGHGAEPIPATWPEGRGNQRSVQTLRAAFQHKTAATRAGLGWVGKNALLITPAFGPRVRLATVLTDLPLQAAEPQTEDRCGNCRACVDACPAGALRGNHWTTGLSRDHLMDVRLCWRTASRLIAERVGAENAVCGVCVAACPVGRNRQSEISV